MSETLHSLTLQQLKELVLSCHWQFIDSEDDAEDCLTDDMLLVEIGAVLEETTDA